jgi:hypothetical protein
MNVRLHIERVVVDDVIAGAGPPRALHAALEAELTALLAGGGLSPELVGGRALAHVAVPPIQLARDAGPAVLGREIAGAVYGGIAR